ncbi:MAG: hypothetical protein EOO07_09795 [Chitinophagaceae bacterium]|nr:MAG: hypothetical protein EOO07_09795 [Chitinophagaceae bacterium]
MKSYLFVPAFFILNCLHTYGQEKLLYKTWISKDLDYIKIDNKRVYFELYGSTMHEKQYAVIHDTLRLYDSYTSSKDNFSKRHTENFDFRITELTASSLALVPLNLNAKTMVNGRNKLEFIDKKAINDKSLVFNEIRYRVHGGGWGWVDISFCIDKYRNFKYVNKSKKNNPEYFVGKLSKEQYDLFIDLLKSSEIDKLYGFSQVVFDTPEHTLEVDYNGKSQRIKQDILPAITIDLVNFISGLAKEVSFSRVDSFEINFRNQ